DEDQIFWTARLPGPRDDKAGGGDRDDPRNSRSERNRGNRRPLQDVRPREPDGGPKKRPHPETVGVCERGKDRADTHRAQQTPTPPRLVSLENRKKDPRFQDADSDEPSSMDVYPNAHDDRDGNQTSGTPATGL